MNIFVFGLSLLLVSAAVGPVGHFLLTTIGGPDLLVLGAWAVTWFLGAQSGLRFALISGVLLDLTQFTPPGYWTAQLVLIVALISWLRGRYLQAASVVESLLAMLAGLVIGHLFEFGLTQSLDWRLLFLGLIANVCLSLLIYYFLGSRVFFQRWSGKRL